MGAVTTSETKFPAFVPSADVGRYAKRKENGFGFIGALAWGPAREPTDPKPFSFVFGQRHTATDGKKSEDLLSGLVTAPTHLRFRFNIAHTIRQTPSV